MIEPESEGQTLTELEQQVSDLEQQIEVINKEIDALRVALKSYMTATNPLNIQPLRCIVACENSNGEPDLFFVIIRCTEEEVAAEVNYDMAREAAEQEGYSLSSSVIFFDYDAAGKALEALFEWDTATVIDSPGVKEGG